MEMIFNNSDAKDSGVKSVPYDTTTIGELRHTYEECISLLNNTVKECIWNDKEMKGIMLYHTALGRLVELHDTLSSLYELIATNASILDRFGSQRLKQLGHTPVRTATVLKKNNVSERDANAKFLVALAHLGMQEKEHWALNGVFITEIEYMLDVLSILIEPDWVPLEEERPTVGEKNQVERYIPAPVKIAVWRRDQAKCVNCQSQERLEYDHIIPISKGGSNTERNVQLLCEKCNRAKAAQIE